MQKCAKKDLFWTRCMATLALNKKASLEKCVDNIHSFCDFRKYGLIKSKDYYLLCVERKAGNFALPKKETNKQ